MTSKTYKLDWWTVNGYYNLLTGLIVFMFFVAAGSLLAATVGLVFSILLGVGLLKKSLAAFWIMVAIQIFSLLSNMSTERFGDEANTLFGILGLVQVVIEICLIVQIYRDSVKHAVQRELKKQGKKR